MKSRKYIFPAVVIYENNTYDIIFPDVPGCVSAGDTLEEVLAMGREALELHLYGMESDGDEMPKPSNPTTIELEENEFITLIEANMIFIRDKMENRAVKKTLTIPKWLNDIALENEVNFSEVLQTALKEKLNISNKN